MAAKKTKLMLFGREMDRHDAYRFSVENNDGIRATVETDGPDGEWQSTFEINTYSMTVEGGTDFYETKEEAAKALERTLVDLAAGVAWLRAGE